MNKLEARIIMKDTGNYDEEELDEALDVYEIVLKHVGFEDKRSDNRFVVKFHDIFYYAPDETDDTGEFDNLFEEFCEDMYRYIEETAYEKNISIDDMLHPMYVGHYQTFVVDIPEITKDNAIDVAMLVFNEFGCNGRDYVENYIQLVNVMQDLEDNYMEYWFDFIDGNEYFTQETINKMKDAYHKDIERRKAAQTLAK